MKKEETMFFGGKPHLYVADVKPSLRRVCWLSFIATMLNIFDYSATNYLVVELGETEGNALIAWVIAQGVVEFALIKLVVVSLLIVLCGIRAWLGFVYAYRGLITVVGFYSLLSLYHIFRLLDETLFSL